MSKVAIHWIRHGQRFHDNPALLSAIDGCSELYPLFIWDNFSGGLKDAGYNRIRFIHGSLRDLDATLQKHGGRLYVRRGEPDDVIRQLIKEWKVTHVTVEHDLEPVWGHRDARVRAVCKDLGVVWEEHVSLTLYDEKDILKETSGRAPSVFDVFKNVLDVIGQPPRPRDPPDLSQVKLPVVADFQSRFQLPSLSELGHERPADVVEESLYPGGETEALNKLDVRMENERKYVERAAPLKVSMTQDNPMLLSSPLSLSPYLRMGCLSIRKFYWSLRDNYETVRKTEAPFLLTEHLIWRDFFYIMSVNIPNYDKMEGNPLCLQIDWYRDQDKIDKWQDGQTGFPWIDACMRQLRQEGWIHHVCRHAVTCFLTRGDLWIHWEEGFKVFERYLLDADWSVCAGNWMWVSSSAFENCLQCPQCYSPFLYGARMDPSGEYVKRYVPEVRNLPLRYVFTPWKAPAKVQKEAGCVIGKDYPAPMVDHQQASTECKKKMEATKSFYRDINLTMMCNPSSKEEVWSFSYIDIITNESCSASFECSKMASPALVM